MRWRRHGRRVVQRVKLARARFRQPSRERWAVVRADGTVYAGPYKYQGQTFTRVERLHYYYGSETAARRAWEELGGDRYSRVPSKKISVRQIG